MLTRRPAKGAIMRIDVQNPNKIAEKMSSLLERGPNINRTVPGNDLPSATTKGICKIIEDGIRSDQ